MNSEKVLFSFFMILALTLNFGFFIGEMDDAAHHNVYELFAVIIVKTLTFKLEQPEYAAIEPIPIPASACRSMCACRPGSWIWCRQSARASAD